MRFLKELKAKQTYKVNIPFTGEIIISLEGFKVKRLTHKQVEAIFAVLSRHFEFEEIRKITIKGVSYDPQHSKAYLKWKNEKEPIIYINNCYVKDKYDLLVSLTHEIAHVDPHAKNGKHDVFFILSFLTIAEAFSKCVKDKWLFWGKALRHIEELKSYFHIEDEAVNFLLKEKWKMWNEMFKKRVDKTHRRIEKALAKHINSKHPYF